MWYKGYRSKGNLGEPSGGEVFEWANLEKWCQAEGTAQAEAVRRERAGPQGEQEGKQWETVLRGKSEHGYMGLDCQAGSGHRKT